ncbi:precorrin-3B synthase [Methylobrevis pamukkalensis]|uniref:Sulfite reductase [ferredoxin] n=1 Tax=Methylobrevis pamukkalensis TaxID=1439726 RepID=A0A1E3H223_9HYPH|nr:precorrin-3B synthase [Methylobrevis pamukkalensis]ODN69846.1 Sulfite reductase [ferredoxin] [Methylobrevis pamukkalensis]
MSAGLPVLPSRVKGWCPGALRPMMSGDGLVLRLRATGGRYDAATFAALAELSLRHGNGLADLSARANLQLRGITEDALPALHAALADLGLLDDDPDAEAVRNVIAPPLAGHDPAAILDGHALVTALDAGLRAARDLHALPGKFGFLVDDGGRLSLEAVLADIRLEGLMTPDGPRVRIALATDCRTAAPVALVPEGEAVSTALALARAFLALRGTVTPAPRRMAGLVKALGAARIAAAAGLDTPDMPPAPPRAASPHLGLCDGFLGVGAPFGRLEARHLALIARHAPGGLRLTPWRSLVLPGADPAALKAFAAAGLIVAADDDRLAVEACPGAPACSSGEIETRTAAARLAPLAARLAGSEAGPALHISGCVKGCAHPEPSALTLVGRGGAFDLVTDGTAGDLPSRRGLAIDEVETLLAVLAGRPEDPR